MTATTAKTILITGCSSGIGEDAAKTLHARGWRVFATVRRAEDAAPLEQLGVHTLLMDYTDQDSIDAALSEVLAATDGRLDALFNNGAHAIPGAVEDLPTEALRAQFEANFFGWHHLTCGVIPVMRAQGHGRIVQCSSVLGFVPAPWRGSYVSSKYALEGLSDVLRLELAGSGIDVILVEPGPITTAFRKNAASNFERWIDWKKSALAEKYEHELRKGLYSESVDGFELPALAVTAKLIRALEARRPKARYRVTTPTYVAELMRRALPTRLRDRVLGGA